MEQQQIQLKAQQDQITSLALTFAKCGKIDKARELVKRLVAIDEKRIKELSKIHVDKTNYEIIMKELRELYWLYKV